MHFRILRPAAILCTAARVIPSYLPAASSTVAAPAERPNIDFILIDKWEAWAKLANVDRWTGPVCNDDGGEITPTTVTKAPDTPKKGG